MLSCVHILSSFLFVFFHLPVGLQIALYARLILSDILCHLCEQFYLFYFYVIIFGCIYNIMITSSLTSILRFQLLFNRYEFIGYFQLLVISQAKNFLRCLLNLHRSTSMPANHRITEGGRRYENNNLKLMEIRAIRRIGLIVNFLRSSSIFIFVCRVWL